MTLAHKSDLSKSIPVIDDEAEALEARRARAERASKSADAFRSIGEAAKELGLKTHVLRFWETRFDMLQPVKRGDGRRYYRREDIELLKRVKTLLHEDGLTIRGALKVLEGEQRNLRSRVRVERADAQGPNPVTQALEYAVEAVSCSDVLGGEQTEIEGAASDVAGRSVRDLQGAVLTAVEDGAFRSEGAVSEVVEDPEARERLEILLGDLTALKSRLDKVRTAA